MMKKIKWPHNKKFAFTIVDDTDGAFLENIQPVYDCLNANSIKTTKTIWVYKSKNHYKGDYISNQDPAYLNYLKKLQASGFEMAFHNAGSGSFLRNETIEALDVFKKEFNCYPRMHINHSNNTENIYWGPERFYGIVKFLYRLGRKNQIQALGTETQSDYFWGDFCKDNIQYIRNRTFKKFNTMDADKRIVRRESGKEKYSNFWFSASDAKDLMSFKKICTKKNIDKLEKRGGCCILYTHFAYGFVNDNGELDKYFKEMVEYISNKDGWFVPCSEILDHLVSSYGDKTEKRFKLSLLDFKWFFHRLFRK